MPSPTHESAMNLVILLPRGTSEIVQSTYSEHFDIDWLYSIFSLLIYDYYHHTTNAEVHQLDLFSNAPTALTEAEIARELYDINLSGCHDLTEAEFVRAALAFYRVALPLCDYAMQRYQYLQLTNTHIEDVFNEVRDDFDTYLVLTLS